MREVVTVAHANEVGLAEDTVDKTMAFIDKLPYAATASMQRDIIEGRPSELASQNGAVVRMGLERGILTPTHTDIYAALLPQELRARGEVKF
jgi:2-dehydropantoate 2-reductase